MPRERSKPSEEFKARKLAVQKRLEREGRWEEASRFKEEVRKACRASGLSADDSVRVSWEEMERNFPPLPAEEVEATREEPSRDPQQARVMPPDKAVVVPVGKPQAEPAKRERATFVYIPPSWGELPEKAKFDDEVEWVYQNYALACEQRPSGNTMRLSRCRTPAPSMGAVGLLEWAIDNRTSFFKDVLPRVKRGMEEEEADAIRAERKSIEEIERILDRMMEVQT